MNPTTKAFKDIMEAMEKNLGGNATPNANNLTSQQQAAIQKLKDANGTFTMSDLRPMGEPIWLQGVTQIEDCVFIVGNASEPEVWEWLINSPYQVKMESKVRVQFLDPAGAVAFKLMFVKGPRIDYPSNITTR